MLNTKTPTLATGGLLGSSGITVGGAYGVHRTTLVTIGQRIEEEEGVISLTDKDWRDLRETVRVVKGWDKDDSIRSLKLDSNSVLRDWCLAKKKETYASRVLGEQNSLLDRVRSYCYLTIGTKIRLLGKNLIDHLSPLTSNLDTLNSYTETVTKGKKPLNSTLKEIKKIRDVSSQSEALRNWCFKAFRYLYGGRKDKKENAYSLTLEFCIPSTVSKGIR